MRLSWKSCLVAAAALFALPSTALAANARTTASPQKTIASYCSSSGDVCYGIFNRSGKVYLRNDGRAVLQALQPLCPPTPSRDRCDARAALRLVPGLSPGRLDLGIVDQLRASIPDHGSRSISRDVEARFGPARAAAVLPAAGAEL